MNIIINGACGKMGQQIATFIQNGFRDASLVASVDLRAPADSGVFNNINDFEGKADCIIDFSFHTATVQLLEYAIKRNIPVVIATTGHDENELAAIHAAAEKIPVFFAANMSLGIALLINLAKTAAIAFPDANIEIIEKHHNQKLDVPSGTAKVIAEEILSVSDKRNALLVGRHENGLRPQNEIGIHSIRAGNIIGEHEVIIATNTQVITLKHEAQSRALFAEGALIAAYFVVGKPCGLYGMKEFIGGIGK